MLKDGEHCLYADPPKPGKWPLHGFIETILGVSLLRFSNSRHHQQARERERERERNRERKRERERER